MYSRIESRSDERSRLSPKPGVSMTVSSKVMSFSTSSEFGKEFCEWLLVVVYLQIMQGCGRRVRLCVERQVPYVVGLMATVLPDSGCGEWLLCSLRLVLKRVFCTEFVSVRTRIFPSTASRAAVSTVAVSQ